MAKFNINAEKITATKSNYDDADRTTGPMTVKYVGFDIVNQSEADEKNCIQKFVLRFKRIGKDANGEVKHWLNYSYGNDSLKQKSMNYIAFNVRQLQQACAEEPTEMEELNLKKAVEIFQTLVGRKLDIDQHQDERANSSNKLTVSYIID